MQIGINLITEILSFNQQKSDGPQINKALSWS